ncbi:hypothetical protein [Metabacillus iocasae]|uniref:Uncharacterized protein n=1 Tax=Priestia iocasae TaxID=2291674 RepID=A0ABS2QZU7_9BACI|nr:hypothetical protein [Metabacillus iocasae]MBM7704718.1 hypothetical protein [Metabacillus iocasae]
MNGWVILVFIALILLVIGLLVDRLNKRRQQKMNPHTTYPIGKVMERETKIEKAKQKAHELDIK